MTDARETRRRHLGSLPTFRLWVATGPAGNLARADASPLHKEIPMTDRTDAQTGKPGRSEFANEAEVSQSDRVLLETPGGTSADKEPGEESLAEAEVSGISTARPASDVTDVRDAGTDVETDDGLTATEESLREAAEDTPTGAPASADDEPVFDRGDAPPRI
jgi:hypothetical protein